MSTITEIVSGLSAAAPYATAIEDLAVLGIDITKLITPDQAQQNDNARTSRNQEAADSLSALLADPTSVAALQRWNTFDDELHVDAGYPVVGGMDCETVSIRVDRLLAKDAIIADYIALRSLLNQLSLGSKQSAAVPATPVPTTPK